VIETLARIRQILTAEDGQALTEFALILLSVALACIIAATLLGAAVTAPFTDFVAQSGFGAS
jgi:Flp pilus assembly pilin Flp